MDNLTRCTFHLGLATLLLAWPFSDAALAVPIENGSFEIGPEPGTFVLLNPGSTAIDHWTVTRGNIHYVGSYWNALDGSRSIDLEGTGAGGIGGVAQEFPTSPNATYVATFHMAGNPDGPPTIKPMRVAAAGQFQDFFFDTTGHSRASMGWEPRSFSFTATSNTTMIEFYSLNSPPGNYGPVIDNVAMTGATPVEETSWGRIKALFVENLR